MVLIQTKICRKCGIEKSFDEFHKSKRSRYGIKAVCKSCILKHKKEYDLNNREKSKKYYLDNIKRLKAINKIYRDNHKEGTQKRINRWYNDRRKNDSYFRLKCNIKGQFRQSLKGKKNGRHWETLTGYSLSELKQHLEKQFSDGMTWDNYGEWHVDHKIPLSLFNITGVKSKGFKKAWSLENLQPLWGKDNLKKRDKLFVA